MAFFVDREVSDLFSLLGKGIILGMSDVFISQFFERVTQEAHVRELGSLCRVRKRSR